MGIDQAGHDRSPTGVENDRLGRNRGVGPGPDGCDPAILEHHHAVVDRLDLVTVKQHAPDDSNRNAWAQILLGHGVAGCKQQGTEQ